ncbi:hypothetical protein [Halorussus halophilus]|uniref:hypothetical protein n=1 Tax=Halorussus halophilus TaxID=2650975 RepID=UPI001300F8A1|nr:hypothetical protein [Halorussus halophilus]
MAREHDDSERVVNRRSVLGATGGGVATAFGFGTLSQASDVASAAEYDTITVPAGGTRRISVGSGETLENVLIDMTADGASAQIHATGSDWVIRNVGFKGEHPGGHRLLTPGVTDRDGQGLIENVYLGDGQTPRSGNGAIWVNGNLPHKGTITFRNVHLAHFIDNGLYGTPSSKQIDGVVNVEDSYFNSNNIANIRLGSGSGRPCYVRNTVVKGGSVRPCGVGCSNPGATISRGVWAWWGEVIVEDSDIGSSPAKVVNTSKGDPEVISQNTRWGSDANTGRVPSGVPMTAEEAASGTSSGSGGGSGSDSDDSTTTPDDQQSGTVLELVSASNASTVSYEFVVDGSVQKRTSAGDVAAENNDSVSSNGDGSVTVSGVAGNGYGDSYLVDGDITELSLDEDVWTVTYGGEEVTPSDFALPNKLVIDGGNAPNAVSEYTFTVSGEVRKSDALGSINSYDEASDGTISGRVVGGKDGYRFSGEITGFELSGPASVQVEDSS